MKSYPGVRRTRLRSASSGCSELRRWLRNPSALSWHADSASLRCCRACGHTRGTGVVGVCRVVAGGGGRGTMLPDGWERWGVKH